MLYLLKDKKGVGRLMLPYRLKNYDYQMHDDLKQLLFFGLWLGDVGLEFPTLILEQKVDLIYMIFCILSFI
jgi:hypothetical protein